MVLEDDQRAGPLAFVVPQVFAEAEEPFGAREIEDVREVAAILALAVTQMPRTREPVIAAGGPFPADDVAGVPIEDVQRGLSCSRKLIFVHRTAPIEVRLR
jgi:hypothetical protein